MRSVEEILFTGAYNRDEELALQAAGYAWKSCRWCYVAAYVQDDGLCQRCGVQAAHEDARSVTL